MGLMPEHLRLLSASCLLLPWFTWSDFAVVRRRCVWLHLISSQIGCYSICLNHLASEYVRRNHAKWTSPYIE